MKTLVFFSMLVVVCIIGCKTTKPVSTDELPAQEISVESSDSTEYELIVFDPRFETFLATQPYPKEFYSDNYYQQWNYRYCIEWNIRHTNPMRYGDFYETSIPYELSVNYGLDFNFRLYQYFQFIEQEYGIVLIRRRGR
ncbi:hypothetical protein KDU71_03945 [Carboxylicivirga sediminis]|uniref:Uncharacterized protein n=1 Tax=Carboxylicivirga sediminis TaxID=2006564 RepID=A0A941F2T1_9BACT|nr:DUF6146 family protein [Carboxylicivirga sediminis]MBR8534700.1 hypothetical protein [Carboxylicivirga sediminis]